ncbi:phytanoyl-CoA dioxygenase family protein [Microbulbifer sp. EKSA005]|uniref:phytanoyl-CoA dioxygenase family protein n=1 Tax=Microbulbifer sp. EKSA005 TaxID=3243364 RepID=UPI004042DDEA
MLEWGHVRVFTPWPYIIDKAVANLLDMNGWVYPNRKYLPTGREIVDEYLGPSAKTLEPINKSTLILFSSIKLIGDDFLNQFMVIDLEMKAGECLIFSSLNLHASHSNTSDNSRRFSFVGRCTANHIKVAPCGKGLYSTYEGLVEYDTPKIDTFQVFGNDTYGYNEILKE